MKLLEKIKNLFSNFKTKNNNKEQDFIEEEVDNEELKIESNQHYKDMSPMKLVLRRFFRSRLSVVGLITLIALFAFSFLGPLIMEGLEDLGVVKHAWGEIEVDDANGVLQFIEQKYEYAINGVTYETYFTTEMIPEINMKDYPSLKHFLGTDESGMDVFSRLMYGGRISLMIGFIVVILETILGIILGGIAGYFGKWVDQLIMRIVDIFNCIPTLPILLIAAAALDAMEIDLSLRIYYLMAFITLFGWSGVARMVRGQILYLREQEYMVAAEVMGLPTTRKIFKHLIPNIMPQLIVSMTLGLGGVILYESTLSYLGIGVPMPYAAWGTMISAAKSTDILLNYPNLWVPAGACIVLAVLGFNFVGDGLRDAFDPKMKR